MTTQTTKKNNTIIRCQSVPGSRQDQIINAAKSFYGARFKSTVELALIDLFEPLHVALKGGSEQEVQAAITRSSQEIRDLHREALNQCRDYGYSLSAPDPTVETPLNGDTPEHDVLGGSDNTLLSKGG